MKRKNLNMPTRHRQRGWVQLAIAGGQSLLSALTGRKERKRQREAEASAAAAERARQERLNYATGAIDYAFDQRRPQYDAYAQALRAYLMADLDREHEDLGREQRFTLARRGLTGGSASVDAARRLGERYQRGVLDVERRTQDALSDLIASDEQSRLNLLQLAMSGYDTTTAAQRAARGLSSDIGAARTRARAESLGDIFADTRDIYRATQRGSVYG